jgi:hypothetical protein
MSPRGLQGLQLSGRLLHLWHHGILFTQALREVSNSDRWNSESGEFNRLDDPYSSTAPRCWVCFKQDLAVSQDVDGVLTLHAAIRSWVNWPSRLLDPEAGDLGCRIRWKINNSLPEWPCLWQYSAHIEASFENYGNPPHFAVNQCLLKQVSMINDNMSFNNHCQHNFYNVFFFFSGDDGPLACEIAQDCALGGLGVKLF